MSGVTRPRVFCVCCGQVDESWTVVQAALAHHVAEGERPVVLEDGAFEVWDVCAACCEDIAATDWRAFEEPPL